MHLLNEFFGLQFQLPGFQKLRLVCAVGFFGQSSYVDGRASLPTRALNRVLGRVRQSFG